MYRCFSNTKIFHEATDTLVWNLIDPNAPTSQVEMNQRAHEDFATADAELKNLFEQLTAGMEPDKKNAFEELQSMWEKYREKKVDVAASAFEGGTAAPAVYYSELHSVTKARVNELKMELNTRADLYG